MIRILHVIGSMGSGGAEAIIMNIYRQIDRSKIQFDFVVHTKKKAFYDDEIRALGGKIYTTERYNVVKGTGMIFLQNVLSIRLSMGT